MLGQNMFIIFVFNFSFFEGPLCHDIASCYDYITLVIDEGMSMELVEKN